MVATNTNVRDTTAWSSRADGMLLDAPKRPASILVDDISRKIISRVKIYGSKGIDQYVVSEYPPSHHIKVDKVINLI